MHTKSFVYKSIKTELVKELIYAGHILRPYSTV